jgi:hypothetical protein
MSDTDTPNSVWGYIIPEKWTWPDPPTTPRDIIAVHVRNWGPQLAYGLADGLLADLAKHGFNIVSRVPEEKT